MIVVNWYYDVVSALWCSFGITAYDVVLEL